MLTGVFGAKLSFTSRLFILRVLLQVGIGRPAVVQIFALVHALASFVDLARQMSQSSTIGFTNVSPVLVSVYTCSPYRCLYLAESS